MENHNAYFAIDRVTRENVNKDDNSDPSKWRDLYIQSAMEPLATRPDIATTARAYNAPYVFNVNYVSPLVAVYPIFQIRDVRYQLLSDPGTSRVFASLDRYTDAEFEYESDLRVEAENVWVPTTPTADELHFLARKNGHGNYDWLYRGHVKFKDLGESIGSKTGPDLLNLTPSFYIVETTVFKDKFIANSAGPYNTLEDVCQTDNFGAFNYYVHPTVVKHDPSVLCHVKGLHKVGDTWYDSNNSEQQVDPFIDTCIGYNYMTSKEKELIFVATPVYVFERDPKADLSVDDDLIREDDSQLHPASSPAAAPRREAAVVNPNDLQVKFGGSLRSDDAAMKDHITTGIEDVLYEQDDNAPAEYFTISGIRVAESIQGQVYIVRRGSSVSKEYYK